MLRVVDALKDVGRLAIDTAPIIYFVERHPEFGPAMRSVFGLIDSGQVQGATSTITLTELLVMPFQKGDQALALAYKDILLRSAHFEVLDVDPDIAEEAARLRSQYRLRTPDALQVATATRRGCSALLTNDSRLQRVTEIRTVLVSDLQP
jgi:predicted nucleic acid-binding protein